MRYNTDIGQTGRVRTGYVLAVAVAVVFGYGMFARAFNNPTENAGLGGGAILTDGNGNVAIGTSTIPSNVRFTVGPGYETETTTLTWSSVNTAVMEREFMGAFTYNNYIYVTGGDDESVPTSTVLYAPISPTGTIGAWQSTTPLTDYRAVHVAFGYNGYAYVAGGFYGSGSSVEYAPINPDGTLGAWSPTTDIPFSDDEMAYLGGAIYNGRMYVFGGETGGADTLTEVHYATINPDGTLGSWSDGTDLPQGWSSCFGFAGNGYLYAAGGRQCEARGEPTCSVGSESGTSTVWSARIYSDGSVGSWSENAPLLYNHTQRCAGAVSGDRVFVGGGTIGYTDNGTTSTVVTALMKSSGVLSWDYAYPLDEDRQRHGMAANGNFMYAFGGVGNTGAGELPGSGFQQTVTLIATTTNGYGFQVFQPSGNQIFAARNDGSAAIGNTGVNSLYTLTVAGDAYVSGTLSAGNIDGTIAGSYTANAVQPGVFATSSGTFAFRDTLALATTTLGASSTLFDAGTAYLSGLLGIGTSSPAYPIDILARSAVLEVKSALPCCGTTGAATVRYSTQASSESIKWSIGRSTRSSSTEDKDSFALFASGTPSRTVFSLTSSTLGMTVQQASGTPQDTPAGTSLLVALGVYAQLEDNNAGAPPAADCNADAERGRVSIDTTNNRLYVCNGATRGWDYASFSD